MATNFFFKFC